MTVIAKLRFFFCGKGDTILIKAWSSENATPDWGLVDCCITKSSGVYYRIRDFVSKNDISQLRFVCMTHPDRDHYFGMRKLLADCFYDKPSEQLRVNEFWDSGVQFKLLAAIAHRLGQSGIKEEIDELYRFLFRFTLRDDIEHRALNQGYLSPMKFGDFYFLCLSPRTNRIDRFNQQTTRSILRGSDDYVFRRKEESNNLSVVLVFMHRTLPVNIILGGDATSMVWKEALATWDTFVRILERNDPRFAAIKVSHHGAACKNKKHLYPNLYSDYATPQRTVAILTIGAGDPKHPDTAVLNLLKRHSIHTYATCELVQDLTRINRGLLPGRFAAQAATPQMAIWYNWADIEVSVRNNGSLAVAPSSSRVI